MKYFIISDDMDALTGVRLAGVEGGLGSDPSETAALLDRVKNDQSIALLLITESCADMCRDRIDRLRLSAARPLVAVIPGRDGAYTEAEEISRLIRETIGVKI